MTQQTIGSRDKASQKDARKARKGKPAATRQGSDRNEKGRARRRQPR